MWTSDSLNITTFSLPLRGKPKGKTVRWGSEVVKHSLDYNQSLPDELADETRDADERANRTLIASICLYAVFLCIIFYLSYGSKDHRSFLFSQTVKNDMFASDNGLSFAKIGGVSDYWKWLHTVILPALYATHHLEGSPVPRSDKIFARGCINRRVGVPRLRQHRVLYGPCIVHPNNKALSKDYCEPTYRSSTADTDNAQKGWRKNSDHIEQTNNRTETEKRTLQEALDTNVTKPKISREDLPKKNNTPWTYRTWNELTGVPYMGVRTTYPGGGYVLNLDDNLENTTELLKEYQRQGWIDDRTRAVMLEFSLYNVNTNLFMSVTMLVEFLVTGSTVTHSSFRVFRLFEYVGNRGTIELSLEIIYCCFIVFFTIHIGFLIKKTKWRFFRKFWNLVELLRVTLGLVCIALYGLKRVLTIYVREWIKSPTEDPFLNLQSLGAYDEIYTYTLSLVVFLATLQFIKLLQFHRRLRMLGDVLRVSYGDLRNFSAMFFVFIFSFSMCAFLLFGRVSTMFYNFAATVESLFTIALGDFAYMDISSAQTILAPIFFFTYVIVIYIILMTIFLSILNKAIAEVRCSSKRRDEYHLFEYLHDRVSNARRRLFRCWRSFTRKDHRAYSPQWGQESYYMSNIQDYLNKMNNNTRIDGKVHKHAVDNNQNITFV